MNTFLMGRYKVLVCFFLSLPYCGFTQSHPYSLPDLVDSAKNHLPLLFQKSNLTKSYEASIIDIKHSFLPQIRGLEQINLGTDNSLAGSYLSYGMVPSTSGGIRNANISDLASSNVAVLNAEWELVNFGLKRASVNLGRAFVDLASADYDKELYVLKADVARLYFVLLKEQSQLVADQQNIERYRNIYSVIVALTKSGIRPGSDSSLARAELSKAIINYNLTLGNISQIREQLSFFTGIESGRIEIDTASARIMFLEQHNFKMEEKGQINPIVEYFQRQFNIYEENDKVIRKSFLPRLIFSASAWWRGSSIAFNDNFKSLGYGWGYQRFNYATGIALEYDLFNGIHKRDQLNINHFKIQAAAQGVQQQLLLVRSGFQQAANSIKTAEDNILELPVQLRSAEDTYNQKIAQYKAGIINLVDLTNAAFVLYRSLNDYIEAIGNWYLGQLDKASANGTLENFIKKIK